jgi:PAS domain S-box-containing protein
MNSRGWTEAKESMPQLVFLPEKRNSFIDIVFIVAIFVSALILIVLFPIHELWILYGLLMILIAIRYGVTMAVIGTSWIGALAFLLPAILTGRLGLSTTGYGDFLTTNLDILFLCGVSLITGRAVSDLITEIAERKQSEKALRESEERFRLLSDVSLEGIQIHDGGVILGANLAFAKQLGYRSPDELIGKPIMRKHLTPESLKKAEEIAASKGEGVYEVEGIRNDGTHFPVEITSYILNLKGQDIRIASTRDITKRKQAEENLRTAEIKYRMLVEQIPPIVYIASPDQHIGITYISPRIEALGFAADEWIADPELWVRQLHPDDLARVMDEIKRNTQSGKPFSSEYRLIARDGRARWFVDEAMDIVSSDGKLLYRQGFMLDITERKQVEESLFAREQYLELLNEMTSAILRSRDFDSTLHTLAVDMVRLLNADDCYITRWDEERQWTIPAVTTAKLKMPFISPNDIITSTETDMTTSVLKTGRVLAADDVFNSPYISVKIAERYPARSAIGVPLIVGEHKLGAAIIAYNTPHHFTSDEIEHAEQAGNQVALALWNFQQSLEIQQRLKESEALANIARALGESERTGTGEVLQLIVDSARELMPHAQKSVIHLLDVEEQVLYARAVSGYDEQEKEDKQAKMRLGEGVAGQVIHEGITINIGDIKAHPNFLLRDSLPEFQSLLVAPVQSGGQQIGTISVQSATIDAFSEKDAELLNALGVQAAIAIENTRLFEVTQQRLKEVGALYRTSQGLAASLDADELIEDVIKLLQQNFGYYHVQIYLIEPKSGNLVIKHGSGYIGGELVQKGHQLPAGEGIVGHVAETGEPFFTNNVDEVVFFKRNHWLPDTQSEIAVPIIVDKQVMGVLDIQTVPQQRLTEGDFQLMVAVADQLVVALQKARLYGDLQTALQQEQTVRSQLLQSERLALVGRLLASVSHELNNPLQAIQNALFLLKDEPNLSNQARLDLDVILSEAERMAALIERLRTAYRPVRMKDFRPVELNDLIEDVHTLIAPHMRQKEIVFEFFPDTDLPNVSGLSDQIRQVVLNLFLNAIEVMKPGGRLTVLTRGLPQQNEVLLTVQDTGPGIDPEILPRIFEPFITSKHTGTGLGLTITHDIIEQHSGRIEADNTPQGGAIFSIWLPIHEEG